MHGAGGVLNRVLLLLFASACERSPDDAIPRADGACEPTLAYPDADGDGFGDQTSAVVVCAPTAGLQTTGGDCDDADAAAFPGAPDAPRDGIDQDCDGVDRCASLVVAEGDLELTGANAAAAAAEFCSRANAIGGGLSVYETGLTDLSALGCLCAVGGDVQIGDEPALMSLAGLEGLENAPGDVYLRSLDSLLSLEGLAGLRRVGGDLLLSNLPRLSELGGMQRIEWVEGKLLIQQADMLADLDGLPSLKRVYGEVVLTENSGMVRLDGLAAVTIGGLDVRDNPALVAIGRLEGSLIDGNVTITGNDALADLAGFAGIHDVSGFFLLQDNPSLVDLTGLDALQRVDGTLTISGPFRNLRGLESLQRAERLRVWDGVASLDGLDGLEYLEYLYIRNTALVDLRGMPSLLLITGALQIEENDKLERLDGLEVVDSLWNVLEIRENRSLIDVGALYGVSAVGDDLEVIENHRLPTAEAEALRDSIGVEDIGGTITIAGNGTGL